MDTPLDIAGLDSLGVLLLFMRVEEEFDISSEKVDELMLKNPLTAMDIKNYIN
jgi:acyl carrier protein